MSSRIDGNSVLNAAGENGALDDLFGGVNVLYRQPVVRKSRAKAGSVWWKKLSITVDASLNLENCFYLRCLDIYPPVRRFLTTSTAAEMLCITPLQDPVEKLQVLTLHLMGVVSA